MFVTQLFELRTETIDGNVRARDLSKFKLHYTYTMD